MERPAISASLIADTISLNVGYVFLSFAFNALLNFSSICFFRDINRIFILITILIQNKKNFLDDFVTISYVAQNHVYKCFTLTYELYLKKSGQNINSKKNLKKIDSNAILILQNGKFFKGLGLGYQGTATGEVCFNTSITGYQEIISDPSYAEQIINFTFPHVGNVGTNKEDHESDTIWTKGVIINTEITDPSNYRSLKHLDQWLKNKIVGITGIDTRNLTNLIRDKGAPNGTISFNKKDKLNIKKASQINNKMGWP